MPTGVAAGGHAILPFEVALMAVCCIVIALLLAVLAAILYRLKCRTRKRLRRANELDDQAEVINLSQTTTATGTPIPPASPTSVTPSPPLLLLSRSRHLETTV